MRATVADHADGLLATNQHTLLLIIASSVPVAQMIADLKLSAVLIITIIRLTETIQGDNADVETCMEIKKEKELRHHETRALGRNSA